VTAYLIATTASTPIYGKLGDPYGRKTVYQALIVIFLVGSALAGLPHSMDQLIAFRGLQGLGGGGEGEPEPRLVPTGKGLGALDTWVRVRREGPRRRVRG
jgi:MFS family permease